MDLKLTPKKLLRLINLAEADTPQLRRMAKKNLAEFGDPGSRVPSDGLVDDKPLQSCDSSSGILDLDQCQGIGDSHTTESISRLDFNEDLSLKQCAAGSVKLDKDVEQLKERLEAQSYDVESILRQSIACNSDFVQGDMTAHEAMALGQDISVTTNYSRANVTNMSERRVEYQTKSDTESELSVGAYFKMKSASIFPDYQSDNCLSVQPSMLEADSRNYGVQPNFITLDDSNDSSSAALDSIPVKEDNQSHKKLDVPIIDLTSDQSSSNSPHFDIGAKCNPKQLTALNPNCKQRLAVPGTNSNNESSLGDASLSMSLVAKALKKMDTEASPSTLFQQIKQNPPSKPVRTSKINSNKENMNNICSNESSKNHSRLSLHANKLCDKSNIDNGKKVETVFEKNAKRIDRNSRNYLNECKYDEKEALVVDGKSDKYESRSNNVVLLSQIGKTDTASSAATVDTILRAPQTNSPLFSADHYLQNSKHDKQEESFTPHANSTVSETDKNTASETKHSTLHGLSSNIGETGTYKMLSPEYRPLDTSINWGDIIPDSNNGKKNDNWIHVDTEPAKIFVGVNSVIDLRLQSKTDSILTCKLSNPNKGTRYNLDLPKKPILLRSNAVEHTSIGITTDTEFNDKIQLKIVLQDLCSYEELTIVTYLDVESVNPTLEVISDDCASDFVEFPPAQRGREVVKTIGIKSDCNNDLLIEMEASDKFSIYSVNMVSIESLSQSTKSAHRVITTCSSSSAVRDTMRKRARGALLKGSGLSINLVCQTPSTEDTKLVEGVLRISLMNTNVIIKSIPLRTRVGTVKLQISQEDSKKLCNLENGKIYTLALTNAGTVESTWRSNILEQLLGPSSKVFSVTPTKVTLRPNEVTSLQINYTGPAKVVNKGILILKNIYDGKDSYLDITGGNEPTFKTFPIRATHRELSWTKANISKELRLKNISDVTIKVKCQVRGRAFKMAVSGLGEVEEHSFHLVGQQCVTVNLIYRPDSGDSSVGRLVFSLFENPNDAKSVRLHGSCDKVTLTWSGVTLAPDGLALVTLPAGVAGPGATLTLSARGDSPAFVSASFEYNWQYRSLRDSLKVTPARAVLRPGSKLSLKIDVKDRLRIEEMEGKSVIHLATLEVLTGPLIVKKRLQRILDAEKQNEELKVQLEPLKGHFEGEDQYRISLEGFQESSRAVTTLMSELRILKAGVTLRPDLADATQAFDDNSIAMNYLTLCDNTGFPETG